ncbi:hypothetical protein K493DRAFT_90700 [Basidiobolus meristosporus CBS 931.73]|uniref:Zinc-finger domain-containing protein n=1 Tax=Basidiobolus meristosporus CBS 931.73 TaxID=1314790 RepID=A0A1Y1XAV8_9FUNG|nr:hypothetical protein K493DRAFT_90700 [Basidiobolus meristosporus CBS 931.73]|eukprot:ORX82853.1 hypothetical protein K493DRAFT_90700 [Basidiobolus meristosporus CBS 931.73]
MNDYEVERQKRIEANKLLLQSLGLSEEKIPKVTPKVKVVARSSPTPPVEDPIYSFVCTATHNKPVVLIPKVRRSSRARGRKSYTDSYTAVKNEDDDPDFDFVAYLFEAEEVDGYSFTQRRRSAASRKPTRRVPGVRYQGNRVYDSLRGSTCHQCRQKTMDEKVRCTNVIDGVRCNVLLDDMCITNRYGMTVKQAKASGNWLCPVCQGICNCSICRRRKGLPPTGILAHVCDRLGYASAAELLASKQVKRK